MASSKTVKFKISGPVSDLLHMLTRASGFAESDEKAEDYLRYGLCTSSKKEGVFTSASSLRRAIQVKGSQEIEVHEEGRILVPLGSLIETLSTLSAKDVATLEYLDDEKKLQIQSGRFRARVGVLEITRKTVLPSVIDEAEQDELGEEIAVEIEPESFAEVFNRVSQSRAEDAKIRELTGILLDIAEDANGHKFVMTGSTGRAAFCTDATPIKSVSDNLDKFPSVLLHYDFTAPVIPLLNEGDRVEMLTYSSKVTEGVVRDLYYRVWDKDDNLIYFIKTNTLASNSSRYNRKKLLSTVIGLTSMTAMTFSVNKSELLHIMRQGSTIGAIEDPQLVDGQSKTVSICLDGKAGRLTAFIRSDDEALYQNSISIETDSDEVLWTKLSYGIYGSSIAYSEGDTLDVLSIVRQGVVIALLIFNSDGPVAEAKKKGEQKVGKNVTEDNIPQYFATIGLKDVPKDERVLSEYDTE